MSFESTVLLRAGAALLVAVLGAAASVAFRKISHFALCALISVAAGALLSVTLLDILPEAYEMVPVLELVLGFLSGYLLFFLISKYVYHICPACAATHTEERFLSVNYLMIIAISLHSAMDGIGVAVGYSTGNENLSLVILLAVSFHKFPEGLALASVARGAGYSRSKAFLTAFAVETTTLLGAVVSMLFLRNLDLYWFGIILAHIGGGFFYLTVHAMLGEMVKHERRSIVAYAALGFASILLMTLALSALGI